MALLLDDFRDDPPPVVYDGLGPDEAGGEWLDTTRLLDAAAFVVAVLAAVVMVVQIARWLA